MLRKLKAVIFCAIFLFMTDTYILAAETESQPGIFDGALFDILKENMTPFIKPIILKVYDLREDARSLILVNYRNPIPESYSTELVEVEYGHKVDKIAADGLKQMLSDMRSDGLSPVIVSSYRTNAKQDRLFKNEIQKHTKKGVTYEDAVDKARTVVAYPGTSEHQMGLAVDIVSRSYQALDTKQENTPEAKWLKDNCIKYGFVLRYQEDKSNITEIIYEPWHYRYVGERAAKEMSELDFCLEEYVEWRSNSDGED